MADAISATPGKVVQPPVEQQPLNYIKQNGKVYAAIKREPGADGDSFYVKVCDYLGGSSGVHKFLKLIQGVCKAAYLTLESLGNQFAGYFKELSSSLSTALGWLALPRLPKVTKDAYKALSDWTKEGVEATKSSTCKKIQSVTDAMATFGYAGSLFAGNYAANFATAADVPSFVNNFASLTEAAEDYSQASGHLDKVDQTVENKPIIQRFSETRKEALMRVVKSTASVFSGAIGLMVLAFGGPVLSAGILLGFSLLSTVAAITAHFYKNTCDYELINFQKQFSPEVLVSGVPSY